MKKLMVVNERDYGRFEFYYRKGNDRRPNHELIIIQGENGPIIIPAHLLFNAVKKFEKVTHD